MSDVATKPPVVVGNGKEDAAKQHHTHAPNTLTNTNLKATEPQKCCEGGNCAECGKTQPLVTSSPEFAVIEQQVLSGDFDSFFDSLPKPGEPLVRTEKIEAVLTNGDGSALHVGKTNNTFGSIKASESAQRYYQAPSPLTSTGLGVTPTAERLVSIGSVPKQAAMEGFTSHHRQRDTTVGASTTLTATLSSFHTPMSSTTSRDYPQTVQRERVATPSERSTTRNPAPHQPERMREVQKAPTPPTSVSYGAQTPAARPSSVSATTPRQESARVVSRSPTTSTRPHSFVPSSFTSHFAPRPTSRDTNQTPRASKRQAQGPLKASTSSATSSFRRAVEHTRASRPITARLVRGLERGQELVRNLQRMARELSKGVSVRSTTKATRLGADITKDIQRLIKNIEVTGARSADFRKAADNLVRIAKALSGTRNTRDNKTIARGLTLTLKRINANFDKRAARITSSQQVHARNNTNILTRKALLNARLQTIRGKLERIRTKYKMKSNSVRRSSTKRSLQPRRTARRTQLKTKSARTSSARLIRKSKTQRTEARPRTRPSPRHKLKIKAEKQRHEVRLLRREVKALRQSLRDILPVLELIKGLNAKRRTVGSEEEFDIRGFSSERQLKAILKRKNLSSRERKMIEKELAKRKRSKINAVASRSMSTGSKKQNGTATNGATESSKAQNSQTDAEMKSYAKTLSTFSMRTDDSSDQHDAEGPLALDE